MRGRPPLDPARHQTRDPVPCFREPRPLADLWTRRDGAATGARPVLNLGVIEDVTLVTALYGRDRLSGRTTSEGVYLGACRSGSARSGNGPYPIRTARHLGVDPVTPA